MEHPSLHIHRTSGLFALIGAITMLIGTVAWGSTGTDLWAALENGTMAEYLSAVTNVKTQLVINATFWGLGVIIMGMGITGLAEKPATNPVLARIASKCAQTGVAMGVISFILMLSLAIQIAPDISPEAVQMANVIGWIGTRIDDVATILIIGVGPFCLSMAGRQQWVPGWLKTWGIIVGLASILAFAGLFVTALSGLAILLVPIGIGWVIAAGITAFRHK